MAINARAINRLCIAVSYLDLRSSNLITDSSVIIKLLPLYTISNAMQEKSAAFPEILQRGITVCISMQKIGCKTLKEGRNPFSYFCTVRRGFDGAGPLTVSSGARQGRGSGVASSRIGVRPTLEVVFAGAGVLDCNQDCRAEDHGRYRQADEETEHAHSFRPRSAGECRDFGMIAHGWNGRKGILRKYFCSVSEAEKPDQGAESRVRVARSRAWVSAANCWTARWKFLASIASLTPGMTTAA